MDIQQAIHSRRSVRGFTAQPVDRATIVRVIDAAVQAPSAVNEQPWFFVVVEDPELLSRVSREAKSHLLRASPPGLAPHLRDRLADPDFDIFYGAPALIVIASVAQGTWAVENCALAAQNLMLAACAEGLGTCWIGFAQSWLATHEGKAMLGLVDSNLPVAPIIVGHPKSVPPPVPRRVPKIRWIGNLAPH
jgi:nitroreductase